MLEDIEIGRCLPGLATSQDAFNTGAVAQTSECGDVSLLEFLRVLMHEHDPRGIHLACVPGDPKKTSGWKGKRLPRFLDETGKLNLPDDHNLFFIIDLMKPETSSHSAKDVSAHGLIVLDDIGTKVPLEKAQELADKIGRPTATIETSPGNYQWFFRLDMPVPAGSSDEQTLNTIRAFLKDGDYSDKAVQDPARYMRLPAGINGKLHYQEKYGLIPRVRLASWDPLATVNLHAAAAALFGPNGGPAPGGNAAASGPLLVPEPATSVSGSVGNKKTPAYSAGLDTPFVELARMVGLNPRQGNTPGIVQADCPNHEQHSDPTDTSGFSFIGDDGACKCHHDHCAGLKTPDFHSLMRDRYDADAADCLAQGRDAPDGKHWSAQGFLADAAFRQFDARTGATPADIARQVDEMLAQATANANNWVEDLNREHALVKGIDGIVCLPEDGNELFVIRKHREFERFYCDRIVGRGKRGAVLRAGTEWPKHSRARRYERMGLWYPDREPQKALNLFRGLPLILPARQGASCSRTVEFIETVIARNRTSLADHVFNWLAFVLQHPLDKPGTNLVLFGAQGTGKSTLGKMMLDLFSPRHSLHIQNDSHLFGRFNGHLEGKLFAFLDEALFARDPHVARIYKTLTTEDTLTIEDKGQRARTARNHLALMVASNSISAVPIEPGDRRATVIEVSAQRKGDTAYFQALWDEWSNGGREAFAGLLLNRDISAFNPRQPFNTEEKVLMGLTTGDHTTRFWSEILEDGVIPGASMAQIIGASGAPAPSSQDWQAGPVVILNRDIYEAFELWARGQNLRHKPAREEVIKRIGELCPGRDRTRPRANGRSEWGFRYPKLDDCTAMLRQALEGQAERRGL